MRRSRGWLLAGALVAGACAGRDAGVVAGPAAPLATTIVPDDTTGADSSPAPAEPAPDPTVEPAAGPGRTTGEAWPDAPPYGLGDPMTPASGAPGLDVLRYDVALDYDLESRRLTGSAEITLRGTVTLAEVALDAADTIEIGTVSLDGNAVPFQHTDGELIVEAPQPLSSGEPHELSVRWTVIPQPLEGPDGIPLGWFATADGSFVLDEPDGMSTWMPANDHPSDKALWRFTIDVPSGYTAVANGALVEHQTLAETERWVWDAAEPMSTYLVLVLTGRFDIVDGPGIDGVAEQHAVLTADRAALQPVLDLTDDMLTFFSDLFGPYPFETYGIAVTDATEGLAMETQTRSLFDRNDMVAGPPDSYQQLLLAHELAHQWFGDAVTPAEWSDIWLNEGFATYGEWLWLDHAGFDPVTSAATQALQRPRRFPPTDPTPATLFDRTVYDGGAVVLHALRLEIGDDAFFTVLREWADQGAGDVRTTEDFVAFASAEAGRDLTSFFDTWLFTEDPPDAFPT